MRRVEQLVVRNAAPQEERQARGEFQVADAIGGIRRDAGRILLDAEQELRTHQHRAQRHLDAGVETALRPGVFVELQRNLQIASVTGRR